MTVHVEPLALPGGSTDVLRLYAREIAIERTRLLYLGSRTPTLLMLLGGVTSACLVWGKVSSWLLGGWLVWLVLLAVLRLLQSPPSSRPTAVARPAATGGGPSCAAPAPRA